MTIGENLPRARVKKGRDSCHECSVPVPYGQSHPLCRCCAADANHPSDRAGADTASSVHTLPPAPRWPLGRMNRYPRLERIRLTKPDGTDTETSLWWVPKGQKWVVQHPLEYPRDRLADLNTDQDRRA